MTKKTLRDTGYARAVDYFIHSHNCMLRTGFKCLLWHLLHCEIDQMFVVLVGFMPFENDS